MMNGGSMRMATGPKTTASLQTICCRKLSFDIRPSGSEPPIGIQQNFTKTFSASTQRDGNIDFLNSTQDS
jgi:hypothetical protein